MILDDKIAEYACGSCGYRFYRIPGREKITDSFCPECGSLRAKRAELSRKFLHLHSPGRTSASLRVSRPSPGR